MEQLKKFKKIFTERRMKQECRKLLMRILWLLFSSTPHPPPELGHVLLFKNLYLKQYFFPSIFNRSLHNSKMKSLEKLTYIYIHKYLLKQNS